MVAITKFRQWYNTQQADSLYAMFSPRMQAALPLDKTKELLTGLHAQFGTLKATEIAEESSEKMLYKGIFEKTNLNIVFVLNEKNQLSALFFQPIQEKQSSTDLTEKDSSNFNIVTEQGANVYGTLLLPQNSASKPSIVLIIAGSGPTDRNCNSPLGVNSNAYKMLADSLSKAGIASVRYDKRGVGESKDAALDETMIRFDDFVHDAVAFIKKIKSEGRFGAVYVLGHSEGSLIGMIAAQKEKVNGFISLAGAGESADLILKKQLNTAMPNLAAETESVLKELREGKTVEVKNEQLASIFRSAVQPYLISWFAYDPQKEIAKLNIPILIIQGTTDLQIKESDAQSLKRAKPNAQLVMINNMNHVLKLSNMNKEENLATYNKPDLPIASDLIKSLLLFLRSK